MTDDQIIRAMAAAGAAYADGAGAAALEAHLAQVRAIEKQARYERRHILAAGASEMRFRLARKLKAREAETGNRSA